MEPAEEIQLQQAAWPEIPLSCQKTARLLRHTAREIPPYSLQPRDTWQPDLRTVCRFIYLAPQLILNSSFIQGIIPTSLVPLYVYPLPLINLSYISKFFLILKCYIYIDRYTHTHTNTHVYNQIGLSVLSLGLIS